MFFLLYVPTIRRVMSRQQMEQTAAQLADQVLAQTVQEQERTPEAREAVRAQLLDMMISIQEQFPMPEQELEGNGSAEIENSPAEIVSEPPELADMRNYLERCLRQSA
jgi:hypothetical protein